MKSLGPLFARYLGKLTIVVLLLPAPLLTAAAQNAPETLNNEALVEMVKEHLGDDSIVEKIRSSPCNFTFSAKALTELKQQGVSEKVIAAMQAKIEDSLVSSPQTGRDAYPAAQVDRAAHTQNESQSSPAEHGAWQVGDATDRMSGETHMEAVMSRRTTGAQRGVLQVRATCDGTGLSLLVAFLSDSATNTGFKQNWYGTRYIPGGLVGALVVATSHKKPWVEMRMRIDNNPLRTVTSENDYTNYATVLFVASENLINALAGPAGTVNQFLSANTVLVEVPFADDTKEILEIRPQDPSFRNFAARCESAVAPPPPAAEPNRVSTFHTIGPAEAPLSSMTANPVMSSDIAARTFKGNAAGLASALPSFIQQAVANGVVAQDYSSEIRYIDETAQSCGHITRKMIADGTDQYGMIDIPKFQQQYIPCFWGSDLNVSANARRGDPASYEHLGGAIMMRIKPRGKWGDGTGFDMSIHWVKSHASSTDFKVVDALIADSSVAGQPAKQPALPINEKQPEPEIIKQLNASTQELGAPLKSPIFGQQESSARINASQWTPTSDGKPITLTHSNPAESRQSTITAPGRGQQNYNLVQIDTRDFTEGGTLVIDIKIAPNSATDGSFDLFPGDAVSPGAARTAKSLAGSYDVRRGTQTRLTYRFQSGQVFALNLEGNWFSPKGATGSAQFQATVMK